MDSRAFEALTITLTIGLPWVANGE